MSKAEQALRSISGGVDTGTPTVLPSLPTVPKTGDANVEQFMSALKQTVETWAGKRGDSLDSAVTWRELVNKNFATIDMTGTGIGGSSGGAGNVIPVDPNADVDYTPPPAPTGLVATGALSTIILDWDVPTYTNHAYTEIWRSGTNVLGSAELIGMTPGAVYSDSVGGGFTYYYWIRFVSKADVAGAYNKTDGTMGQTALDPGYLLDVLNGQISESELATTLNTRINLVDAPATTSGSVNARIKVEADPLKAQYTVKVDANGYVSGFGLASTLVNATPYSKFIFKADQFAFGAPGQTSVYPFVIQASATTVNGVAVPAGVYIDAAYIKDGTITNTKIGNAAIDTAKISDAAITTAKIGDANITTAKIADAAITNAKINSLDAGKITTGYLAADRIDANSITASKIDSRGLAIKDLSGNIILAAGSSLNSSYLPGGANGNLVRGFKSWTLSGSLSVATGNLRAEDRTVLIIPSGANAQAASSPTLSLSTGVSYTVSFKAWTVSGSRTLYVDLFPDTLPESSVLVTTEIKEYSFTWSSTDANMASCALRFFAGAEVADLRIVNVKLELGDTRTPWVPHYQDSVNVNNPLTTENVSTYIADAAIQNAQIGNIIQSSNFIAGSSGWRIDKAGSAEFSSGNFRGDITGATGVFSGSLAAGTVDLNALVGSTYTFTTAGSTSTLYVPEGYTSMRVTMIGGGGGGGAGHYGEWSFVAGTGGGGGAGQYVLAAWDNLTVGAAVTIYVGAGGAGGVGALNGYTGNSGASGSASYINLAGARLKTASGGGGGGGGGVFVGDNNNRLYGNWATGSAGSGWPSGNQNNVAGLGGSPVWGSGGSTPSHTSNGTSGSGYGSGGGGGGYGSVRAAEIWPYSQIFNGGAGAGGKVIVEFYNPNAVVLRSEYTDVANRLTTVENTINAGTLWQQNKNMTRGGVGSLSLATYINYQSWSGMPAGWYDQYGYLGGAWRELSKVGYNNEYSSWEHSLIVRYA